MASAVHYSTVCFCASEQLRGMQWLAAWTKHSTVCLTIEAGSSSSSLAFFAFLSDQWPVGAIKESALTLSEGSLQAGEKTQESC